MLEVTRNFLLVREPAEGPEELVDLQRRHADALEGELQEVQAKRGQVMSDRHLTPEGKQARLHEIGQQAARKIATLEAQFAAPIRKKAELGGAILSDPMRHRLPPQVEPEEARSLEREIRDRATQLAPVEAEQLYLSAARKGDTVTVRAFERAPGSFQLLRPEVVDEGRHLHAQALHPTAYGELEQLEASAGAMEWNGRSAQQHLKRLTGYLV